MEFSRFEYGSEEDLEWFPRLFGNTMSAWPLVDWRLKAGREGDEHPALLLSLRFADDSQIVVSMRVSLARGVKDGIAELLSEP